MLFNLNSSDIKFNSDFVWRLFFLLCIILVILSSSSQVFADSASDPFGDKLCSIVQTLQGNTAKAVATVGIFVAAVGFLSGKMQWQTIAILAVGIITIFSANTVITFLGASTGSTCATAP